VLMTKFDILGNRSVLCPDAGLYSDKMINISKWRPKLYISQVGPYMHVFRLCICFSDNLVEFHLRNKEMLQTTIR
jgi:hypothetical protein